MPFIRYRLGDLVVRGPSGCPCGAPNFTLAEIQGRTFDRFALPGGRSIHPYSLATTLVRSASWLRQFQIVQECSDRIRLKLVLMEGSRPPADWSCEMRRIFSERLGEGIRVEMEWVDRIPKEPNGKFRPYYSLVSDQGGGRDEILPHDRRPADVMET
jgi:phenylacetate-coenzyme A ligase PaaK-like adenylate-forming protein